MDSSNVSWVSSCSTITYLIIPKDSTKPWSSYECSNPRHLIHTKRSSANDMPCGSLDQVQSFRTSIGVNYPLKRHQTSIIQGQQVWLALPPYATRDLLFLLILLFLSLNDKSKPGLPLPQTLQSMKRPNQTSNLQNIHSVECFRNLRKKMTCYMENLPS